MLRFGLVSRRAALRLARQTLGLFALVMNNHSANHTLHALLRLEKKREEEREEEREERRRREKRREKREEERRRRKKKKKKCSLPIPKQARTHIAIRELLE
jgi:flagellar biosynthesis GTPase FlhF